MRVLVTGATGFFGRHLVPALSARGHQVRAASRQIVAPSPGVEPVTIADFDQPIDWAKYVDGMDAVVHLAALAHVHSSLSDRVYDRVNRAAAIELGKAAHDAGARFIFMSSVAAQSSSASDTVLTEQDFEEPSTAYGRAKWRAEQEITGISTNYVILRPTLAYGRGVGGNMQRIVALATSRIPPPLGAIHNRRSLLAVETMCDAVGFVMESEDARNQTLLLADATPVSTATIVARIREGAGLNNKPIAVPAVMMKSLLVSLGRKTLWDKLGGNLEVSVARLRNLGFEWQRTTENGLRRLGEIAASDRK